MTIEDGPIYALASVSDAVICPLCGSDELHLDGKIFVASYDTPGHFRISLGCYCEECRGTMEISLGNQNDGLAVRIWNAR